MIFKINNPHSGAAEIRFSGVNLHSRARLPVITEVLRTVLYKLFKVVEDLESENKDLEE
jgi:hypothetical protein